MRHSCKALAVVAVLAAVTMLVMPRNSRAESYISTGDGGWEFVKPKPSAKQWTAVYFVDDKTGWIVGNRFAILKTTDGGKNWAPQGQRVEKFPYDMCFTDEEHGWVVGSGFSGIDPTGIIFKTSNGGATWRKVLDGKTSGLRGVCFVNNKVGWAVGGGPGPSVILKSADGGETWIEQDCGVPLKDGQMRIFEAASFVDENTGYVFGNTDGNIDLFKTTNGGRSWSHTPRQSKGLPLSIQFLDAATGWILTGKAILRTSDGGVTWAEHEFADLAESFHFSDAQNGVVVTKVGKILYTGDGGRTWTSVAVPAMHGAYPRVHMVDQKTGWSVGDRVIARTSDGGSTWQVQSSGHDDEVFGVHLVNSKVACAVGHARTGLDLTCLVLRTEDGWQTWSRQLLPLKGGLGAICFADENTGWASGGNGLIVATKDAGKTWQVQDSGTKATLMGLHFLDANTGWAVGGEGTIVATSDGGATWTKLITGTMDLMAGVFFLDKNTGWVCGANGRIMKTTDGGKTWKRQPSGETVGLADIFFANESTGWVAGNSGTLLMTTDGGGTWVRRETGTEAPLDPICFLDEKEGWVAGHALVHTSDGGQTWTVQHPDTLGLWDVHFTDPDNGWAVGAWEILRTTTGGLPGIVWAKKQPDGTPADFSHLVVTKKSTGYLLAEHPDSRVGIHIKTSDDKPNVGDYIYVHGKVASENGEKIIAADSIDIQCAGWGILPEK